MKRYNFTYDVGEYGFGNPEIEILVDPKKYTNAMIEGFLYSYDGYVDNENNPLDEVIKKIALEAIKIATKWQCDVDDVIEKIGELKNFPQVDGSMGITLVDVDYIDFDEDNLSWEAKFE